MNLQQFFASKRNLWWAYGLLAVVAALSKWLPGFDEKGYTKYENYRIFKFSWHYLHTGQNPYSGHPETWDLYKYSPAFSVFMAPFNWLPDGTGLAIWNILNAFALLGTLLALPRLAPQKKVWLAWFVLPELMINMQSSQSNGLMAALFLACYTNLEQGKPFMAAGHVAGGAFIKIFGIFAAPLALFYPKYWPRFAVGLVCWMLYMALFPAWWTGWEGLVQLYRWWYELLETDHSNSLGLSVAGWLDSWWHWRPDKTVITAVGGTLMFAATVWQAIKRRSPVPVLAAWMIWVILFNHKAESPTFILAICGAGLWYVHRMQPTGWDTALLAVAFFCSSVTPTDLFPRALYHNWVQPYTLKAVPFIFIWVKILVEIFKHEQRTDLEIH